MSQSVKPPVTPIGSCHRRHTPRKERAVNERHSPFPIEPSDDSADLPSVFDGLVGIDVVDGELVPREAKPLRE